MRQPNLKDLSLDKTGTEKIRAGLAKTKNIKITINLDTKSLFALKEIAETPAFLINASSMLC